MCYEMTLHFPSGIACAYPEGACCLRDLPMTANNKG